MTSRIFRAQPSASHETLTSPALAPLVDPQPLATMVAAGSLCCAVSVVFGLAADARSSVDSSDNVVTAGDVVDDRCPYLVAGGARVSA